MHRAPFRAPRNGSRRLCYKPTMAFADSDIADRLASGGTTHDYSVFGLRLRSEFALPELLSSDAAVPAIKIAIGDAGPPLRPTRPGPIFHADIECYRHEVRDTARYLVRDGREIIVAPFGGNLAKIRDFLLGTGLAVICHQRGLLPVHASTVAIDGAAVAFVGDSGSGKSTLAAIFHERGHGVLHDDLAVIDLDGGGAVRRCGLPDWFWYARS